MTYYLPNSSICKVQDIFDNIEDWFKPDILFTDPPYNQSLLTNYSNRLSCRKSLSDKNNKDFLTFQNRLFDIIKNIKPRITFLEIGKEWLPIFITNMKGMYKYVTFYNSYYTKNTKNKCYIVVGADKQRYIKYSSIEDKDEADIIKIITSEVDYNSIGDLCMGKGLVGKGAFNNNKQFFGIELNKERLEHLVNYCAKK